MKRDPRTVGVRPAQPSRGEGVDRVGNGGAFVM